MGIEDIVAEQSIGGQPAPRTRSEQQRQQREREQPRSRRSNPGGNAARRQVQLSIPDPRGMDRDAVMLWLNVVQTLLIIWLLLER
jgi:hypothetical protein